MPDADHPPRPRKDRLIQTRVPRDLEARLKEEATRQRSSVSQLIRNVLEDAFDLVDGVVADVDDIVTDSTRLARNVHRNARRLVSPGRARDERPPEPDGPAPAAPAEEDVDDFPHVYAWNELVLNRATACARCERPIARGERALFGLVDATDAQSDATRVCLCSRCAETVR